jgi:uncharacterized cysteine cluster protein YcgN (CxxCxxCC family)
MLIWTKIMIIGLRMLFQSILPLRLLTKLTNVPAISLETLCRDCGRRCLSEFRYNAAEVYF